MGKQRAGEVNRYRVGRLGAAEEMDEATNWGQE